MNQMQDLLRSWQLTHLCEKFEEQRIDVELLKYLTEDQIKCITNNIGDRIRLQTGIENLMAKKSLMNENCEPIQKKIKLSLTENTDDEITQVCGNKDSDFSLIQTDIQNIPIVVVTGPSTDFQGEISDLCTSTATTESVIHSPFSIITSDLSSQSSASLPGPQLASVLNDFNLEEFLKFDIIGQALLIKGNKEGLANVDRDRLSEIVVKHLLNKFGKLSHSDFEILSNKIEELMPKEKKSTYFVPAIPKRQSRRQLSEKARGKLVDKQRNLLYLVRSLSKIDSKTSNASDEDLPHETEDITQAAKDSHIWLKKNIEPTSEVLTHWKRSYPLRKLSHTDTIAKFLDECPILKTQLAPELINLDYEQLQPKEDNFDLESRFEEFFDKILNARQISLTPTDNSILELLGGELTSDSRNAIKLYLLPALVPPKTRTQVGKLHWKPSVAESREGFIIHVKSPGDIEQAKKQQVDRMYKKGLTVQPYILLVGHNLNNVNSAFVIINDITYKCLSVLDSLNFCHKLYHVFDAKYPFECQHIWYLIQWNIYKYFCKSDLKLPFINDLVEKR